MKATLPNPYSVYMYMITHTQLVNVTVYNTTLKH